MTALTNEALRLSPEERLKLIAEVWESLATEPGSLPISSQQIEELERRRERYLADPNSLIDWADLKSRLPRGGSDAH